MWDIKDEIWDKQIGYGVNEGEDFAGREIHRKDFQNYDSPYGWNLIEFDHDDYLVVSIKTEREIPKSVIGKEGAEFRVNGKLFNITRNKHNEWDVNTVEFEEEYIPGVLSRKNNSSTNEFDSVERSSNSYYEPNQISENYDNPSDYYHNDETQSFSFNNDFNTSTNQFDMNSYSFDNSTIQNQQRQIEQLQQQLAYEQTQQLELARSSRDLSNKNKERMAREQIRQKQEIEQLENQLRFQQYQTQQIEMERNNREIENNNQRMRELQEQIARTQQYNIEAMNSFRAEENTAKTIDTLQSMKTGVISPMYSVPPVSFGTTQYSQNLSYNSQQYASPARTMITDLSRKLEQQTQQLESLKMEHKNNAKKLVAMQNNKISKTKDLSSDKQAQRLWEFKYGQNEYANDFANRVIVRSKFGSLEDGGWDIDYFDKEQSLEAFIASTKTINDRKGRKEFTIDNVEYFITKNNGQWEIIKAREGEKFDYTAKKMTTIASNIKPNQNKVFHGEYESYSSLLINLNHFPLIHLGKFEQFLKETLTNLPIFKDMFIYSNERLYKNDKSNISAYARVFFKTSSTKNDIEILLATISLKKGMLKFIENFKITNKIDTLSFSMVLMSHQKRLKFVHAQTNFELLRAHPIPLKIPYERLIIDKEYNSILKFHENNLWKQLKPFALDWNGNVYYVCDLDPETFDVTFQKQIG